MPTFREYDDVVFIAGITFQSEYGVHTAGTEVQEAASFNNLQVLIDNKFLYPVAPEQGYNYLPPHLFNHINVRDEVMAKIEGALSPNPDHFQDGKKPESLLLAEREARQKLTEMSGDTKEAQKAAQEARQSAQEQYQNLQTVDANPAVQDKGGDVTKMHKGDKAAWEILDAQAEAAAKAKEAEPMRDAEQPKNLRASEEKKETKLKDSENPDKAASKKPVKSTDAVADPVGKQPSNVTPEGSKPANAAQAGKSSTSKSDSASGAKNTSARSAKEEK